MQRRMASENNLVATQDKGKKNQLFEDEYSSVKRGAVEALANADFTLTRGTYIRCSLETKIVSTLPGMTSCIVTEPIYSVNGRRLLIDKGVRGYVRVEPALRQDNIERSTSLKPGSRHRVRRAMRDRNRCRRVAQPPRPIAVTSALRARAGERARMKTPPHSRTILARTTR